MRTPTIGAIQYAPSDPPDDPAQLQRYLRSEFTKIASAVSLLALGHLDFTHVAPAKPREGDERNADGTHWNPGGGRGRYIYSAGVWTLVKALP